MIRGSAASILVLALLVFSPVVAALSSDREQPIHIEADSVQIDDLQGVSIYRGNVVYSQGTIRLEADIVHLYHDEHRRISRLEAHGEPARFRQRLEGDDEDMLANARRMEYIAQPERLVLEHDAYIWRQNVEFTGDYISYDAEQDLVSARKDDGNGRVHIVIPPRPATPEPSASEQDAP
jgi:lipopolysaccharide export system protein LptA